MHAYVESVTLLTLSYTPWDRQHHYHHHHHHHHHYHHHYHYHQANLCKGYQHSQSQCLPECSCLSPGSPTILDCKVIIISSFMIIQQYFFIYEDYVIFIIIMIVVVMIYNMVALMPAPRPG